MTARAGRLRSPLILLMVLVVTVLLGAATLLPPSLSLVSAEQEPTAGTSDGRIVGVSRPGSRSTVVRSLLRAVRAADAGRRIPSGTRPSAARLPGDVRTLPARCAAERDQDRHDRCAVGATDAATRVVLFGSSHAAMWLAGLEPEARRLGVRIEPLIKYGCPPWRLQAYVDGRRYETCSSWREWAIDQIQADPPDLVVVASHTTFTVADGQGRQVKRGPSWNRQWRQGVRGTVAAVQPHADRVVVLGDATTRRMHPHLCAPRRDASMRRCEQPLTRRTRTLLQMTRKAGTAAGAAYLDTNVFFCVQRRCPVVARRYFLQRDNGGHVPASYAYAVRGAFARSLGLRAG